jgi:mono/diheme cytochrome c family protein
VKRFVAGFLTGALGLVLVVLVCLRSGLVDVRADATIPPSLAGWLNVSAHASVVRQASSLPAFVPATDANVIAGGKLYMNDCVGCHGEPDKPPSDFGATFYPPAPQLALEGTRYSEQQVFWIAKHGVRRTGMSAQADSYSDGQLRLLAAFIARMPRLSSNILTEIRRKPESAEPAAEPKR